MARLRAALALGGALTATALAACSGSSSDARPEPKTTELSARSASTFVDSIGVNVHLGYGDTSYSNLDGVLARLKELGVTHVRDAMPVKPTPRLLRGLSALPSIGVTADVSVGQTPRRVTQLLSPEAALASIDQLDPAVRKAIDAIEVPNEWDLQGGANWVADITSWTRGFGTLLRNDPIWGTVTYVGPSTGRAERVAQLPDLGSGPGHIDVANLHVYAGGGPPESSLKYIASARKVAPGKPLWATEVGYHTAVEQDGRQPAVTESQQGSYLIRQLLENYNAGVARSYVYELAEEKPNVGLTDQEQHFGLLRTDLTPKPAFTELKTLLAAVRDPAASTTAPAAGDQLQLSLETPGSPVGSLLLRRSDGSYRLILWARGDLTLDGASASRDARVNLVLKDGARQVSVRRTTNGTLSGESSGDTARITGRLGGDPLIVDIASTRSSATASGALTFDASGLPPGAATTPHGKVGQLPDRVKTVLVAGFAFVLGALAVTIGAWINRRRRHRRSQA